MMDFKQLEYFCALAREKHFAKAAKACHITQPTLSNSIKKLEAELNVELVVRGHNFMALTAEGEHFLTKAETLLTEYTELKRSLNNQDGRLQGTLRIGVVPQCQLDIMPLIKSFRDINPHVKIQLSVLTNQQIMTQLANHAIDVGLGFESELKPAGHDKFQFHPQGKVKLALLLTAKAETLFNDKQNQLTGESIALANIIEHAMCLLSQDMQFRQYIDVLLLPYQAEVNIVFETNSVFHLINAVKAGIGCALVTLETAKHADLPYRQITESFDVAQTVLINRKQNNSLLSSVFIEHCVASL